MATVMARKGSDIYVWTIMLVFVISLWKGICGASAHQERRTQSNANLVVMQKDGELC